MSESKPRVQLRMIREGMDDLPPLDLPSGLEIRKWEPGTEPAWERIISESFHMVFHYDVMTGDIAYCADHVFFAYVDGEYVATASAFYRARPLSSAWLHMVGTRPDYSGRRLGYWVCLAALYQFRKDGARNVALSTDDFRLNAIATYMRLGFKPVLDGDESYPERWQAIRERMEEYRTEKAKE